MYDTLSETAPILKLSEMAEELVKKDLASINKEIRQRLGQGEHLIDLSEDDFNPSLYPIPTFLRKAVIKAYEDMATKYYGTNDLPDLQHSLSRFIHIRNGLEYKDQDIMVGGGARVLIHAAFQTLLDPGEKVILSVPSSNTESICHLALSEKVLIDTKADNGFLPHADDIKARISEASLLYLCSPQNPSGAAFSRKQLEEICLVVLEENRKRGSFKKPLYILYDHALWSHTLGSTVHHDPVSLFPKMKNYTIFIDSLSKTFASSGLRLGWACGPQKIIEKMRALIQFIGALAPMPEQVAAARFLQEDAVIDDYLEQMRNNIYTMVMKFYEGFKALKEEGYKIDALEPKATPYLSVKIDLTGLITPNEERITNARDTLKYLISSCGIVLAPFSLFGAGKNSHWYRLSVTGCESKTPELFFDRLRNGLKQLA